MKIPTRRKPTAGKFLLLRQLCNLIPNHLVPQLAQATDSEAKARTFTPWSHVVSLLYAQVTHSLGLNDVCDALRLRSGPRSAIRGATLPSKNGLSHANRQRDPRLAEQLFWKMPEHLQSLSPAFGARPRPRFAFRFKRVIHVVDSTTIQLVARCLDWAKHRRREATAKGHVRLNLQTFLPQFALVDTAGEHDSLRAREVCAGLRRVNDKHINDRNRADVLSEGMQGKRKRKQDEEKFDPIRLAPPPSNVTQWHIAKNTCSVKKIEPKKRCASC